MSPDINTTEKRESIREWLEYTIANLVDYPDRISVRTSVGEQTTVFLVHTERVDVGKIIGKNGETATAIRLLLQKIAVNHSLRCVMELDD